MNQVLAELLKKHSVENKPLLTELASLFEKAMKASKGFGKRSNQLIYTEEETAWNTIDTAFREMYDSDSAFAQANIDSLKERYGLYKRQTTYNREGLS